MLLVRVKGNNISEKCRDLPRGHRQLVRIMELLVLGPYVQVGVLVRVL